jgi:uncharacterized coiled-coil DUF342 family protein
MLGDVVELGEGWKVYTREQVLELRQLIQDLHEAIREFHEHLEAKNREIEELRRENGELQRLLVVSQLKSTLPYREVPPQ